MIRNYNYNYYIMNDLLNQFEETGTIEKVTETTAIGISPIKEKFSSYLEDLGDGQSEYLGYKTKFKNLNDLTYGLRGLIVLAGATGVGKTTFTLQLAFDVAEANDAPVIYYSLEMPYKALMSRILSNFSGVPYKEVMLKGRYLHDKEETGLSKYQYTALEQAVDRVEKVSDRFYIRTMSDERPITSENIQEDIEKLKKEHGKTPLVVVDQLQDMPVEDYTDRLDKEGQSIRSIYEVQEKTGACIICMSHRNKEGMKTDKRGKRADNSELGVKGSVDLVYKPQSVWLLDKEEGDEEQPSHGNKNLQLKVVKSRDYPTKTLQFTLEGDTTRIKEA
jgi:replicative DNA helicase